MFQLEQQEQPKHPLSVTMQAVLAMRGTIVTQRKTLKQDFIPGEKLHLWQTSDSRVLVILERDRKFISIQEESGTLKQVLPQYEQQWTNYFTSLVKTAH